MTLRSWMGRILFEYLAPKSVRVNSLSMRSDSGSVLVDLRASNSSEHGGLETTEEYDVTFDASRRFGRLELSTIPDFVFRRLVARSEFPNWKSPLTVFTSMTGCTARLA